RPGDRGGAGDVAAAEDAFLRVVGHVGDFAGELLRAADVDERQLCVRVGERVVVERADGGVVAGGGHRVVRRRRGRDVLDEFAAFGLPFGAAAVEEFRVRV